MPPKQNLLQPSNQPSRAELLQRIKDKRATLREPKMQVSEKEYKKAMATLNTEFKKVNEDPRINKEMKTLYQQCITTYPNIKIPSPVELLNNAEAAAKNYEEYISTLLDTCKKQQITREKFIDDYLNGLYTQYYVTTLGIEIVPEKLRNLVKLNF